jgi:hypothetical protein
VFLAGEQPGIVLAFADRGDEPVDQHTVAAGLLEALVDLGAGHPAQDRLQDLVIAGDRGLGTAEHLGQDLVAHVVPQPEQHRDHCRGQRQHVRPADWRVLPLEADDLAHPIDQVGELSRTEPCHTLTPRRLALDHLPHTS